MTEVILYFLLLSMHLGVKWQLKFQAIKGFLSNDAELKGKNGQKVKIQMILQNMIFTPDKIH